jgi:hypothetical protein
MKKVNTMSSITLRLEALLFIGVRHLRLVFSECDSSIPLVQKSCTEPKRSKCGTAARVLLADIKVCRWSW